MFIQWFIHLLDGSFVSILHPFIGWFVPSFLRSFIYPSIHPFIRCCSCCRGGGASFFCRSSSFKSLRQIRLVFQNRVLCVCVCVCVGVWFHVFRLLVKCCVQGFEWAFLVWIWSTIEDFKAIDRDKEEGESTTDSLVSNCVKLFIRISAAKFVSTCNRFLLQHLFGLLLMVLLRMRMRVFGAYSVHNSGFEARD